MDNNFDNRDFEQYIKRNADQYRMIPSEKVWKGISSNLHFRRRWYGLGLGLLLLGTAVAVTWVMMSYPVSQKQNITSENKVQTSPGTQPSVIKQPAINELVNSNYRLTFSQPEEQNDGIINELSQLINSSDAGITLPAFDNKNSDLALLVTKTPSISGDQNQLSEPVSVASTDAEIPTVIPFISLSNESSFVKNNSDQIHYALSIESVTNSNKAKTRTSNFKKKITWQLYFTPTVSYRKLSDNKSFKNSSFFFNNQGYGYPFALSTDVNKAVTHKPDMGLELGLAAGYPLSSSLKLTAGLQFNINRYDIRAYIYNREQATINLNGSGNNSLTPWTSYRNYNGYKSDWLKNFYFSVSAPVGLQWKLFGNNKTNYGIAGTLQPTYILRDRAYLISTDYKNYAELPDLVRRVNLNTSFEAFISYKKHNTRWQIGPQIRYQALSSFQSKYPIKENLFDYGLKVGISLNQ